MSDFDFEALKAEFLPEIDGQAETVEPVEQGQVVEESVVEQPEQLTDDDVVVEATEADVTEAQLDSKPKQTPEENKAFADMRRKIRELEDQTKQVDKYKEFLGQVASQNGMTPEQIMENYQKQQLEQEAKTKGVPLEMYQEFQGTKQELTRLRQELHMEKFQNEINDLKRNHDLADDGMQAVWDYIGNNLHFNPQTKIPTIKMEEAYFLANREQIINKAVEKALQDQLESKKVRQQNSPVPHASSSAPNSIESDFTDEDIDRELQRMGLNIR